MIAHRTPLSSVERQRNFRARNPGYFKKYRARLRRIHAESKARSHAEAVAAAAAAAGSAAAGAPAAHQRSAFPETLFDLLPTPLPTAA